MKVFFVDGGKRFVLIVQIQLQDLRIAGKSTNRARPSEEAWHEL
jgi:hypothetical protein